MGICGHQEEKHLGQAKCSSEDPFIDQEANPYEMWFIAKADATQVIS